MHFRITGIELFSRPPHIAGHSASPLDLGHPRGLRGCLAGAGILPLAAAAALSFCFGQVAVGQSAVAQTADAQTMEQNKKRRLELQAAGRELQTEESKLKDRLLQVGREVQDAEERLTATEERLTQLEADEQAKRKKLSIENRSISSLLAAVQRMGRNPPPVIITRRSDALNMVRSGMQLRYLFPKFKGKIDDLRVELTALARTVEDKRRERTNAEVEKARLAVENRKLAGLQEQNRQAWEKNQAELAALIKEAERLTKNKGLSESIKIRDKLVEEKTRLGAYEKKLTAAETGQSATRKQPQLPPREPKDIAPREPKVAALPPPSAVELAPSGAGKAANPGRLEPAIPFHLAKSRLPLPARGSTLINFNEATSQGGRSKGIVIKTRAGASITSPCDGWVVYAGAFRSYGQLLIINAGGGYHVLLANLSRLDVRLGQFVLAAEPVGSMGGRARARGKSSDPVLYVEFRKNGKPIDPSPWWAKGRNQRVQG